MCRKFMIWFHSNQLKFAINDKCIYAPALYCSIVTFITEFQHIWEIELWVDKEKGKKLMFFFFGYFWVTIYVSFLWHRLTKKHKKEEKRQQKKLCNAWCFMFYVFLSRLYVICSIYDHALLDWIFRNHF